jgi:hypothetical protein
MQESTRRKLLAVIGGCALIGSALVVSVTPDRGQPFAGSGNGAVNTYAQPTQPAMTTGATATAGPAAATLATSVASPTHKATLPASECNTSGQCP